MFFDSQSPFLLPAMIVAGVLGGMAWAAIPAFLRTRFNASEILTSLMLTYVAQQILIYLVTTRFPFFPLFGGYSPGTLLAASLDSTLDVLRHAILPATSIVLVAIGGWALGMRAMMVTTQGEDYTIFADAIDDSAAAFYAAFGFTPLVRRPRTLYLPVTTALSLLSP